MNITISQGHIDYTLEENESLSTLGLKTTKNIKNLNVLEMAHIRVNGHDRLIYNTSDMESLSTIYTGMTDANITFVLAALANLLRISEEKAFLCKEYIDLDMDHIFIDRSTSTPKFVLLPMAYEASIGVNEWLAQAFNFVSGLIYGRDELIAGKLKDIDNQVSKAKSISTENAIEMSKVMHDLLDVIKTTFPNEDEYFISKNNTGSSMTINMALRYRGQMGQFAFYITKKEFYIGKSQEMDGKITSNPAISRRHALIRNIDGINYIEDLGSSNKTYLNNNICIPGEIYQLRDGDVVKLADMNFVVET
ncbi:MAG: FHA domain-containing protein [Butyrivibrio sp.]|nr:FHA domain-containing protein [Butyrivibrio sp.]